MWSQAHNQARHGDGFSIAAAASISKPRVLAALCGLEKLMTRIDLIKKDEARVARITLDSREISPRHFHTNVNENIVCLRGEIEARLGVVESFNLQPGEIFEVKAKAEHYLVNLLESQSEYLLIQEGLYDFVKVNT